MARGVVIGAFLLASCEQEEAHCYVPYTPSGPVASSWCDCPDGLLYYCASPETCTGALRITTCERHLTMSLNQHQFCEACDIGFTDAGAAYVTCAGGEE